MRQQSQRLRVAVYNYELSGGGVTTFTVHLCNLLSKFHDVTFVYRKRSDHPLPNVTCKMYSRRMKYDFDIWILASAWGPAPEINRGIQVIHADLSATRFRYRKNPGTIHHVAVSRLAKKSFLEKFPQLTCDVIPNILPFKKYKKRKNKVLTLITCSRITKEKGFDRMVRLASMIDQPFKWIVYGKNNSSYSKKWIKDNPQFEYKGYINGVEKEISKADYLVQLSDSEGMPYSILEALQQQTPVIVTNYPSASELVNSSNGMILKMDLSDFKGIREIKPPPFRQDSIQKWSSLLLRVLQK